MKRKKQKHHFSEVLYLANRKENCFKPQMFK